jgi:hypothetical protein
VNGNSTTGALHLLFPPRTITRERRRKKKEEEEKIIK